MTETTDAGRHTPSPPLILFDADCTLCTTLVRRFKPILRPRGFDFAPLQDADAAEALNLPAEDPLAEMKLLYPDGRIFGGADAIIELARQVWWATPFWLFAHLPGARRLLHAGYRTIAARRSCSAQTCKTPPAPANNGGVSRRAVLSTLPASALGFSLPSFQTTSSAEEKIRSARREFVSAMNAREFDRAVSMATADSVLVTHGAPLIEGRDALRRLAQAAHTVGPDAPLSMETLRLIVGGTLACELGRYTRYRAREGAEPLRVSGKYLDVWVLESDGQWRLAAHAPADDPAPKGEVS